MVEGARDYYRRWRDREPDDELPLTLPAPGKRSLIEQAYGQGVAPVPAALDATAMVQLEAVVDSADHPAKPEVKAQLEQALGATFAEGGEPRERPARVPVPAAGPPLLPAAVGQTVQARKVAARPDQYAQATEPEDGEVVAHRARRSVKVPDAASPPAAAPAGPAAAPAPAPAPTPTPTPAPARAAAVPAPGIAPRDADPVRYVLEDFTARHPAPEKEAEPEDDVEIPEDLEGLEEEELDDLADDLDLELPEDATVEQKRRAIEAARAGRQSKALKGVARLAKKVGKEVAADQAAIEKQGKAKAAGRAAQGKAAAAGAKAANTVRTFAKAKNIDELKARLRKVMEEDKAKFDAELKKSTEELGAKMKAERTRVGDELKTSEKKVADEIAAKEKEIAGQIQQKLTEAKNRAEHDRTQARATTEAEKRRRRDEAGAEARRLESEGDREGAAAARSRGERAAQELDGKLAVTLEKIAAAEREGATNLEAEKETMLTAARARAKTAGEEARAKHDAALIKINQEEQTAAGKLKQANEALRKGAIEKFDAQMKKLESGKAEDLAKLEAETNKVIAEIDQEVLRFQATAQAQTKAAVQAAAKEAAAAVDAIKKDGAKACAAIDELAKQAMARVDQHAAEMAARQAAVADEGQRRLTADTPEEAAQVERDAEAREKVERDKVEAEEAEKKAESEAIDKAAAEMADELDDTFVDEEAVLAHLRGKTPEQVAAIKEAYFKKTGRKLDGDLVAADALDEKELKEAKAHLSDDPVQRAVATLENAEDGWTGEEDEQRIKETLAKLDPETRKKVAAEYEKQTGRRLNAMLADELPDADLKDAYVAEDPKKVVPVSPEVKNSPAVNQAVHRLRGATDRWDTDEKAIYEALKGKTPEEIEAIKQIYNEKHGPPGLDQVLEKEMSGTELKEAKAMMSCDPVQQAVASLHNASDGIGTDVEKVQKTLESIKDPVLRAQVAAEFEKQTGQKLDTMIEDELSGRDRDKAEAAAAGDFAALRAIKFDEAKNGNFLTDLSDTMADSLGVSRENMRILTDVAVFAAMAVTGPVGFVLGAALLAHEHIDLRDDENAMYKVLEECETPEERAAMEAAYNKKFAPKTLRGEIAKLDGAEVDIATALLDGDKRKARAAKVKDGSGFFGDKELLFSAIQECESKEERDAMIAEFNRRYGAAVGGTDYNATLDETFKYNDLDREKAKQLTENGKMDDAFALFHAMHSGFLGSSGSGLGTDEEAIKKLLAGKSKEEIERLKEQYKELAAKYGWNRSLEADLDQEVSGRDGKQIEMLMRGEPTTAAEALARQEEMAEFEREDVAGWAIDAVVIGMLGPLAVPWILLRMSGVVDTDELAKGAVDVWNDADEDLKASNERLRQKLDEINRTMVKTPGESDADFQKRKLEAFKKELANEEGYLKNYQEKKDETADVASTGVSLVVTAALSIASGGAAAWACALIGGMAGIGAKAAILGGSYATEDFGMDVVEVIAEAIAAGVAKGLEIDEAVKGLKALGVADDLVAKIVKEALEEAIENGTSELILALFNEDNYESLEAFILGVGGAVLQAAVSGAAAAAVMVTLGALWDKKFGAPGKNKMLAFLKSATTESIGGLAASAVDPATWEGNMEDVLTRFGKGFIDNILSAGAEGIGDAMGAAHRAGKVDANRKRLADQGVGNTAVVSGHIVDLDSGRVFDGESGKELGRIAVDPETGEVTDVTDPSNPVRIGVNENLEGVRIGGIDTNAQAGAAVQPGAGTGAQPGGDPVTSSAANRAAVDEATARSAAEDRARVEAAGVEKAKVLLAGRTGDAASGSSLDAATRIATELALNGVTAELFGNGDHHFLKIGDTVIDGALLELFDAPAGASEPVFIGSMEELRARLGELQADFGLRSDIAADTTVEDLFDSRFAGASASDLVLDIASGGNGQFTAEVDRGPGRIDEDFPLLVDASGLDPDAGFADLQQTRARAALEAMSDADYIKFRSLVAGQESNLARAYLLKALAAGNSIGEIERFASKIHGKSDAWLVETLSLADPRGKDDGGSAQQFTHSCNANMLIALMGDLDPVLALRVRENPEMARLLQGLERQMLETRYQGNNPAVAPGDQGVAVPMGGNPAEGRGRFIDDFLNAQTQLTGVKFDPEMDPTTSRVLDVLDRSLAAGMDVPVVVGKPEKGPEHFAHYVLVTGRRVNDAGFVEFRFYDPATGKSHWVSAADILAGQVGVSGFPTITALEVPSAVAAGSSVDASVDAAADTERTPAVAAGSDGAQQAPGTAGGTTQIDAVLNDAGAMTERVRQMLNRLSPGGQAALERIASQARGESPRVQGFVEWVRHTTRSTRNVVGDALAQRLHDAETELRTVERLLAERPDTTVFMAGDQTAGVDAAGRRQPSSDIRVLSPDGTNTLVEVKRLRAPLNSVDQIDGPFERGIKEGDLPAGTQRAIVIEVELDPAHPATLLDDLAENFGLLPKNQKVDRVTLVDASGAIVADYLRGVGGWARVAATVVPSVAPGASPGAAPAAALPFFDLRKKLGLLTASEKAFIAVVHAAEEMKLNAAGRRSGNPNLIVGHEHVLLDIAPLGRSQGHALMRQLASGDSNGLRALGIDLPLDFDSKQCEWGLVLLQSGGHGIIRGDGEQVDPRGMPDVVMFVAHSHPLVAGREIKKPMHVEDILSGHLQALLHPSGRTGDVMVAREQVAHTIYMPYQYLGNGMIGQSADNAIDRPLNNPDPARPPGIEVVMTAAPRIIGTHGVDADGMAVPVYLVSIRIVSGGEVVYTNDFGLFTNTQTGFERLTSVDRMPTMLDNSREEHAAAMRAAGLGDQVGPIDVMEVLTALPNTPLGFAIPSWGDALNAFIRLATGDASALEVIGMIRDKAVVSVSGIVFAVAQRPDGAFVIVVGDSSGVEVPPGMVEVARGGGPAGIPSLPVAAPVFPAPTSPAPPAPPAPPATAGSDWSSGGAAPGPGAGWQMG